MNSNIASKYFNAAIVAVLITVSLVAGVFGQDISTDGQEWDKSSIVVDGSCGDNEAIFTVNNHGSDMQGAIQWRVYFDNSLTDAGNIQLSAGQIVTFTYSIDKADSIRFEADQRPGHPGSSSPRATVDTSSCAVTEVTPTPTTVATATQTPEATATLKDLPTEPNTPTSTSTPTHTATATNTATSTETPEPTNTPTATSTIAPPTATATSTATPTPIATSTTAPTATATYIAPTPDCEVVLPCGPTNDGGVNEPGGKKVYLPIISGGSVSISTAPATPTRIDQ